MGRFNLNVVLLEYVECFKYQPSHATKGGGVVVELSRIGVNERCKMCKH